MKLSVLPVGISQASVRRLVGDARLTVLSEPSTRVAGRVDTMLFRLPASGFRLPDRDYGRELMNMLGARLRWVHVPWVGVEKLLTERVLAGETLLTNSRGAAGSAVAEYVAGCVIAHAKSLPQHIKSLAKRSLVFAPAREIRGQTALVVGLGDIGKHVARNLKHLGMRVRAVTRTPAAYWACDEVLGSAQLDSELRQADFIVLAAPSTPDTRHMSDQAALARCKPGACLINVARGDLIGTQALCVALRDGPLEAAYLDVFDPEPLDASSPLWELQSVVLTPHISSWTDQRFERAFQIFEKNLPLFLGGRPLLNQVRVDRGY